MTVSRKMTTDEETTILNSLTSLVRARLINDTNNVHDIKVKYDRLTKLRDAMLVKVIADPSPDPTAPNSITVSYITSITDCQIVAEDYNAALEKKKQTRDFLRGIKALERKHIIDDGGDVVTRASDEETQDPCLSDTETILADTEAAPTDDEEDGWWAEDKLSKDNDGDWYTTEKQDTSFEAFMERNARPVNSPIFVFSTKKAKRRIRYEQWIGCANAPRQ